MSEAPALPAEAAGARVRLGMRLDAVEVFNWGTFDKTVWRLDLNRDNTLLTGDIGSGKSTLVDAITTLLIPAHRIAYNKAAGAETRERDLRSYVLGYYKSERGFTGAGAKPVALRSANNYSVILGRFYNEGYNQHVTLAQVFWFRDSQGQPERFFVIADRPLSIVEHFSNFDRDVGVLKKRLRKNERAELFDSFPPYGAGYRKRFGINGEQALDLFHQTVSMKSVGDLTDFVRSHMLQPFPVEERIEHMIAHFEDLNRAHQAVLKARSQIERLGPIVADCDAHGVIAAEVEELRQRREALRPFFAGHKVDLLEKRIATLVHDISKQDDRLSSARDRQRDRSAARDELLQVIAENGGDRIAGLSREIEIKTALRQERMDRAEAYGSLATHLSLPTPQDVDAFAANRPLIESGITAAETERTDVQNALTERQIEFRGLKQEHEEVEAEIASLKTRRSNIPTRMLGIRDRLCSELGIDAMRLPFAGELIEVRQQDREWEGAAERLLHGFALSLLVPDAHYGAVAEWVDDVHLGQRFVYFRTQSNASGVRSRLDSRALANKLAVKDDDDFYDWLRREVDQRFDHISCKTVDEFRREYKAVTRTGQIKSGGQRHEKDDRHHIDDRTQYVLGWSNEDKIAALQKVALDLEGQMRSQGQTIAALSARQKAIEDRLGALQKLSAYTTFKDLDWRSIAFEIAELESERRELEDGSDTLKTLQSQRSAVEAQLKALQTELEAIAQERAKLDERRQVSERLLAASQADLASGAEPPREGVFAALEALRLAEFSEHRLTVESCEARERDMREWLHRRIDNESGKLTRLRDRIVAAMRDYANQYPQDTYEVDATVEAADEYRQMLASLLSDGLPRFEARFKELLNENTIREIASFQSQLRRESQDIKERIDTINQSLIDIDYNPGRYILLETHPTNDAEVRDFAQHLRLCTENTLAGEDESAYSEAKFLQVKEIIERFRGREGTGEHDRRWTKKVTDVRNWFTFSASERYRSDNTEHEHYADSGGKSGGQKEKLAYTILAASLAYQFGLDWHSERSRSFHFVVIDEAFGRGSDESARYGLKLFETMGLQLLIATPLQKIHIIEPFVAGVGFVHNEDGRRSLLRNLTIEEYREERLRRAG